MSDRIYTGLIKPATTQRNIQSIFIRTKIYCGQKNGLVRRKAFLMNNQRQFENRRR